MRDRESTRGLYASTEDRRRLPKKLPREPFEDRLDCAGGGDVQPCIWWRKLIISGGDPDNPPGKTVPPGEEGRLWMYREDAACAMC